MRRTAEDTALTRAALLDAGLAVFAEQGVTTARLADVAARAGVTRGALYHHFADRDALYTAVVAQSWETVTTPIWGALDHGLTAFLHTWLSHLRTDDRFRALLAITVNGGVTVSGSTAAKSDGLDVWRARLAAALAGDPSSPLASHRHDQAAANIVAWLCGTALLAATDPGLLPTDVTALIEGLNR